MRSRFMLLELRGHRFRQVFFKLRGKPLLQHRPPFGRNQQRTEPGAAFLVVPENFGLNREPIALIGECEQNSYFALLAAGKGFQL
jgi:hypothetical protein